jgi:hypothetical protein
MITNLEAQLAASILLAKEQRRMPNGKTNGADAGTSTPPVVQPPVDGTHNHTARAASRRVPEELVRQLNEPLDAAAIQPHPSKPYLSTIKTIYQLERLNQVFGLGGWTYAVEVVEPEQMVVVKVTLEVAEYGIVLTQFGGSDNEDRGDAYKGAVTDALSKLCGYLGIGMDVYKGNGPTKQNGGRRATERQAAREAQQRVAEEKIARLQQSSASFARVVTGEPLQKPLGKPWKTFGEMRRLFAQLREQVGEFAYLQELEQAGVTDPSQFKTTAAAEACYWRLVAIASEGVA